MMKEEGSDKLSVGVYVIQKGLLSYVNIALTKILGYQNPEQLMGKSIWDIIHPDDRSLVKLQIPEEESRSISQRNGIDNETFPLSRYIIRVFKNDKTILWVHMGGSITTYQGRVANKGYIIDMTPFKKAEKYLKYHLMNSTVSVKWIFMETELSATLPTEECWELMTKILNLWAEIIELIWTKKMQEKYSKLIGKYTRREFQARILSMRLSERMVLAGQLRLLCH